MAQTRFARGRVRLLIWRWHRRIGLLSALFVLLLSFTGILLNHTDSLGLDQARLTPGWLHLFYSVDIPATTSFDSGRSLVTQWGGQTLYRNDARLPDCRGELKGAVHYRQLEVLACEQELIVLLAQTGELVERIGSVHGLAVPVERLGSCRGGVCIEAGNQLLQLDPDELAWTPVAMADISQWSEPVSTPDAIRQELAGNYLGQSVSWERLLLDLHSGRLAGTWGVYIMDAMALLFIVLAGSGILIWLFGRRRANID